MSEKQRDSKTTNPRPTKISCEIPQKTASGDIVPPHGHKLLGNTEKTLLQPNTFLNCDCMELMKEMPDNFIDLAIVDPPYGIGMDGTNKSIRVKDGKQLRREFTKKNWDNSPPPQEYFEQLFRVSKNQIIWGGNYFNLPISRGWIFWYKGQNDLNMGDGELAWTSFDCVIRQIKIHRVELWKEKPIHVVQKPVALYRWILNKYAAAGDLILDTHVGSASSLIACTELGFEKDEEYYTMAKSRLGRATRKYELFEAV